MDWRDEKKHKLMTVGRDVGCKTIETVTYTFYLFLMYLLFKYMGRFMGANILYSYVSS